MENNNLYIFSGPCGTGKDFIAEGKKYLYVLSSLSLRNYDNHEIIIFSKKDILTKEELKNFFPKKDLIFVEFKK